MTRVIIALFLTMAWSHTASAHVDVGGANGFVQGFSHPFSGIDHVLAMVAVGAFAAHLGGQALWRVPLTFISVLAVAGLVGMAGINLPFVEIGIGLSVVVLGLVLAFRAQPSNCCSDGACRLLRHFPWTLSWCRDAGKRKWLGIWRGFCMRNSATQCHWHRPWH